MKLKSGLKRENFLSQIIEMMPSPYKDDLMLVTILVALISEPRIVVHFHKWEMYVIILHLIQRINRAPRPNIIYIPASRAQNDQPEKEDLLRK